MKTQELRIGNYVQQATELNTFILKVETIYKKKIEVLYNSGITTLKSGDVQGIPLTRSILLACGFDEIGLYENVYKKDNIRIHADKTGKTDTILFVMFNDDDSIFSKELSYLHQLQNLFFILTGKELDVRI